MKKLCRLIWVMNKCGRSGKADNGAKRAVGDWSSYLKREVVSVMRIPSMITNGFLQS